MGYIFATFNKLTCCIIVHLYIYLCFVTKNHEYSMEYRGISLAPPMVLGARRGVRRDAYARAAQHAPQPHLT